MKILCNRDICRCSDCLWIRLVVHVLHGWTSNLLFPIGISFHHFNHFQSHFHQCANLFPQIGCDMFVNEFSHKATTMSLSILVVVEMFNAINSLSENESLLTFPLTKNLYLVLAITLSMVLHMMILYVPFFSVNGSNRVQDSTF